MRKILMIVLMMFVCGTARAVDLSLEPVYTIYDSSEVKDGLGLKGKVGYGPVYAWIGQERAIRIHDGHEFMELDIMGYGAGVTFELIADLSLSIEGGRYEPKLKTVHSLWIAKPWYAVGIPESSRDYYSYAIDSGYGGTAGLHYSHDLGSGWALRAGVMYRYLDLNETMYSLYNAGFSFHTIPDGSLHKMSFSGVQVGIGVEYGF